MDDGFGRTGDARVRIPLFPLNTVLYPGEPLPLQIFEPRYLQLLADLGDRPPRGRQIGFVAIRHGHEVGEGRSGQTAGVGCLARLLSVERHPAVNAEVYVILALGVARFRLDALATDSSTPYLVGEVVLGCRTDADPGFEAASRDSAASALEASAREEYTAYSRAVGVDLAPLPDGGDALAYRIASANGLTLGDRQAVLEATTTVERLRLVRDLLRRERVLLREFGALPGAIRPGSESPN